MSWGFFVVLRIDTTPCSRFLISLLSIELNLSETHILVSMDEMSVMLWRDNRGWTTCCQYVWAQYGKEHLFISFFRWKTTLVCLWLSLNRVFTKVDYLDITRCFVKSSHNWLSELFPSVVSGTLTFEFRSNEAAWQKWNGRTHSCGSYWKAQSRKLLLWCHCTAFVCCRAEFVLLNLLCLLFE